MNAGQCSPRFNATVSRSSTCAPGPDLEDVFLSTGERKGGMRRHRGRLGRRLRRGQADRCAQPRRGPQGRGDRQGALGEGATGWAQGGIAAVLEEGDSFEAHINDTMIAAPGSTTGVVEHVVESAPKAIQRLVDLGVPFANDGGALHLTREGTATGGSFTSPMRPGRPFSRRWRRPR